jgi:hypothetical protein
VHHAYRQAALTLQPKSWGVVCMQSICSATANAEQHDVLATPCDCAVQEKHADH